MLHEHGPQGQAKRPVPAGLFLRQWNEGHHRYPRTRHLGDAMRTQLSSRRHTGTGGAIKLETEMVAIAGPGLIAETSRSSLILR